MKLLQRMRSTGLSVLVGAILAAGPAAAQDKTVRLLSWGGTVQKSFGELGLADAFEKDTGYKVILVSKTSGPEIIATALAQKDQPQIDVVMTDVGSFWQGVKRDLFAPISDLPNSPKMYDTARIRDVGMQVNAGVLVVVYNEELFKQNGWAPPKGFADLTRPEFKDKIALPICCASFGLYITIELARLNGGGEKDLEPGFQAMKSLGTVKWVQSSSALSTMMESGEAAIGVWGTTGTLNLIKKGVPLTFVKPDPVYLQADAVGMVKNSPNPEGARVLANWLMGDGYLVHRGETFGEIPLNTETKYNADPRLSSLGSDTLKAAVSLDYDFISDHSDAWRERYTREVLGQ